MTPSVVAWAVTVARSAASAWPRWSLSRPSSIQPSHSGCPASELSAGPLWLPVTRRTNLQLFRRGTAASHPPAPPELRSALATIDHAIADYVTAARLGKAAALNPSQNYRTAGPRRPSAFHAL